MNAKRFICRLSWASVLVVGCVAAEAKAAAPRSDSPTELVPSELRYSPKRGAEYAYRVEMTTQTASGRQQWMGLVYCRGIYSDTDGSPAEVVVIGKMFCFLHGDTDDPPRRMPEEDFDFPRRMRFGPYGVYDARAGNSFPFDKPSLPMQMSTILPIQELIFPDVPVFVKPGGDEHRGRQTCTISGPGIPSVRGFKKVTADVYRFMKTENDGSRFPKIIRMESLTCPDDPVELAFKQVGIFDVREGMPTDSNLDYVLRWGGYRQLKVTVRRKQGTELAAIRQAALEEYPVDQWPADVKRIPVAVQQRELGFPKGAKSLRPGQTVAVTISISTPSIRSSRTYRANVLRVVSDDDVLVQLDGSSEQREFDYRSVHLMKR